MRRIGQVAITVNGECCPARSSDSPQFPFTQRVFEILDGPMTGAPHVEQLANVSAIYAAAIAWLQEMEAAVNNALLDADALTDAARSGA